MADIGIPHSYQTLKKLSSGTRNSLNQANYISFPDPRKL